MLFESRKDRFVSRTSPNIILVCFKVEDKVLKNYGLTPLENVLVSDYITYVF